MIQVQTSSGLRTLPRVGSYWKHRNGNIYQVFAVTNLSDRQAEYPVTICYRGPNGKAWSKNAFNFFEKMKPLTEVLEDKLRELDYVIPNEIAAEIMDVWRGMMTQAGDCDGE